MRLDPNYRLVEDFEYIRDSRVDLGSVEEEDLPHMSGSNFGRTITSGLTSPMDVMYKGEYIDIVDTLRITLRTLGPVKIKEYYGRWRDGAPGLHIRPDGSRYRDIIIRTKTTHYGEDIVHLAITPEYPMYNFYPLAGVSKRLTFTMAKITAHQLLDTDGNVFGEEILSSVDVTSSLHLSQGQCEFSSRGAYFDVDAGNTLNDHVTLVTKAENGIFNTALCFCPGRQAIPYHKRALWGWDRDNFSQGRQAGVFHADSFAIGIRICFEVRFPEYFRELYRAQTDLNLILFYDRTDQENPDRYRLIQGHIQTRAVENVCYTLTCNTCAPCQTAPTGIFDRSGWMVNELEQGKEGLLLYHLEKTPLNFGELGRKEISDSLMD